MELRWNSSGFMLPGFTCTVLFNKEWTPLMPTIVLVCLFCESARGKLTPGSLQGEGLQALFWLEIFKFTDRAQYAPCELWPHSTIYWRAGQQPWYLWAELRVEGEQQDSWPQVWLVHLTRLGWRWALTQAFRQRHILASDVFFFCFSIKLVKCHAFIANFPPGVFDLEENLMKSWPQSCSTAYFCCLSNPQNQPQLIRHLLLTLEASPFYQVLKAEPKQMLLLSNLNTPIHSRLWCVFEAHCAYEMDIQAGVGKDEWWSIVGPGWMVECSMFHGFWGCCMVSKALLRI